MSYIFYQSLTKSKGPSEEETNDAHSKRKFQKGSSFRTKSIPQSSTSRKIQKKKGDKGKAPVAADKGRGKIRWLIRASVSIAMWIVTRRGTALSTSLGRRRKRKVISIYLF